MPRNSTKHNQSATPTEPTKHAKPLNSTEPRRPPKQTEEVMAAIYYFGAFGLSGSAISKLILSKYPRAENVHAEDCRDRFVWFGDCLAREGQRFTKTSVGKAVKDAVPFIEVVNLITQIDDQCERILQSHPSSVLAELKDQNNRVRARIMNEFSAKEHFEYQECLKQAKSLSHVDPLSKLPKNNPLPPGALAYEGENAFLGYESPWSSEY